MPRVLAELLDDIKTSPGTTNTPHSISLSYRVNNSLQAFQKRKKTQTRMHRFMSVIVFLAIVGLALAQCKPSVEAGMAILKIIQAEAQKLLECERFSK
ncbi:hypothetical protein Trydic_g579 [Trypoxylus dichotomus]